MRVLIVAAATLLSLPPGLAIAGLEGPPPAGTVTIDLASGSETIWPFTAKDFSPEVADPINLIFQGAGDPREIRQALLSLDGDRTAFGLPNEFPFNCTWSDAMGDEQAAWAASEGWQGSAIQLGCGPFEVMRFHLRLFRQGRRSLGGVHFDVLIPATTEHEVVSWDVPKQIVIVDMLRSGLLAGDPFETPVIAPAPSYRTIRYQVFNGLPVPLRAALGLPLADQTQDVPIPSSGTAMVFDLRPSFVPEHADLRSELEIVFNQVIPKPFCTTGSDFVLVQGPVRLVQRVQLNSSGRYSRTFNASGALTVTPVDPGTGQPTGPSAAAVVFEDHRTSLTDHYSEARFVLGRTINGEVTQTLFEDFSAGQQDRFVHTEECGVPNP